MPKSKRLLAASLLLLGLAILYLNRAYANYYDHFKNFYLPNPNIGQYQIGSSKKPQVRYVALGDSLTAGYGSPTAQTTYPYLLAQKISGRGFQVQLYNLGQAGAGIAELNSNQLPIAVDLHPSYISILIGINDLHNLVSRAHFQADYNHLLQTLTTSTNARITLINLPFLGYQDILFPPYNWLLDLRTRQYNDIIQNLANKYHLRYVDLYTATYSGFRNDVSYYSSDLFHPSAKSYQLWSQLINVD